MKEHETLWLYDGNVVLCAKNLNGEHVGFRVHMSVLSKASPIFADMFALPASNANELWGGQPFIRMPDSAEDLEEVLKILYHETCILFALGLSLNSVTRTPRSKYTVDRGTNTVARALATNHEITSLRYPIVKRPTEDWPTSIETWVEGEIVAKKYGVPTILHAAFYHLSRLSLEFRDNESKPTKERRHPLMFFGTRTARWKTLAGDDYYRLFIGRTKLKKDALDGLCYWASMAHPDSDSDSDEDELRPDEPGPRCRLARGKAITELHECIRRSEDVLHLLHDYTGDIHSTWMKDLCWTCRLAVRRQAKELRGGLWNHLPEFFDLTALWTTWLR
ncbi:hypothetical protein GLOTRDRAFT_133820 [Gloeophyllum trabeum ATCC 11539]|uniref:BTB domain-containing protein n=1 Tax=Gloeophyllum trabeum (strain ATCC 11539 / FP-39264 / Madison 617) TaxID=670483 RepID=S7PTG1_GLOTA|nr:uncharacterized protein GLOTRDRAFT_133820 [Gloeophyllum trabeum ATCC 11539]EPQ50718.1 hypothetical protein GLOTRDRAFT_133820 [Gloeophyllum trabeum ATCC 11539]